jgi:hypothetical protein
MTVHSDIPFNEFKDSWPSNASIIRFDSHKLEGISQTSDGSEEEQWSQLWTVDKNGVKFYDHAYAWRYRPEDAARYYLRLQRYIWLCLEDMDKKHQMGMEPHRSYDNYLFMNAAMHHGATQLSIELIRQGKAKVIDGRKKAI